MKLLLAFIFPFLTAQAYIGDSYDVYVVPTNDYYRLSCEYEYESRDSQQVVSDRFSTFSVKQSDGAHRFSISKEDIPGYFFEMRNTYPYAIWHRDSKIAFNAALSHGRLTYGFTYENYKRNRSDFQILMQDTREIYVGDVNAFGHVRFDHVDGKLLNFYAVDEKWVNEEGIRIRECVIEAFHIPKTASPTATFTF